MRCAYVRPWEVNAASAALVHARVGRRMEKRLVIDPLRRGGAAGWLIGGILLLVVAAALTLLVARASRRDAVVTSTGAVTQSPTGARAGKARSPRNARPPRNAVAGGVSGDTTGAFDGCPLEGDGGDRALNRKKNRSAAGRWRETSLDSILALPWPAAIGDRRRSGWPVSAARQVSPLEDRAVRVEGYVVLARLSGPESTNCHGEEARYRDFHIWLTSDPFVGRERSVIAEMTPRLRARHPSWNLTRLGALRRDRERVRVDGWLLLDQEHPEQIGKTRGTIWEIHPVIGFAVWRGGRWIPLDSLTERGGRR